MTDTDIDLPEDVDDAAEVLEDEGFFIPKSELPEDPEKLKNHIDELYIHLSRASVVINHNKEKREKRRQKQEKLNKKAKQYQERADEVSERVDEIVDDIIGTDRDG